MYIDVDTVEGVRKFDNFRSFHIDNVKSSGKQTKLYGVTTSNEQVLLLSGDSNSCVTLYEAIVKHDLDVPVLPLSGLISKSKTSNNNGGEEATIPKFLQNRR